MTTTSKTKIVKPSYKTEKVYLDSGEVTYIKRCSTEDMETLMEIQERLLNHLVDSDGELGPVLINPEVISDLKTVCSILPIVGKEDTYLDYEDIKENWEQLIKLFFTDGLNEDTRVITEIIPSKVSNLHFLGYMKTLRKIAQERQLVKDKD